MSYLNGKVLADLLLGDEDGLAADCPFVNRHLLAWPADSVAAAAKHLIRNYLVAEDTFYEEALPRLRRQPSM